MRTLMVPAENLPKATLSMPPSPRQRRDRSAVTLPGYHKGREPGNKGVKLKMELLTVAEVQTLLDSFGQTSGGLRNRAIILLFYSHGLKVGELTKLDVPDYSPERAELTIPKTGLYPTRTVALTSETTALLDAWLDAREKLGIRRFAPLFCTYQKGDAGRRMRAALILGMIKARAQHVGIKKRVHSESLRASGEAHRSGTSLEREAVAYLDQPAIQARYPRAYEAWKAAQDLAARDPKRNATKVGHECREALASFTSELAALQQVKLASGKGTVNRLRAIVAEAEISSRSVRDFLDSLIPYWGSVSDLAQRQEHGAEREREPLGAEDARRLLFHTMCVMHEVDRSILPRGQERPQRPSRRKAHRTGMDGA
jgi:Phage integrase family